MAGRLLATFLIVFSLNLIMISDLFGKSKPGVITIAIIHGDSVNRSAGEQPNIIGRVFRLCSTTNRHRKITAILFAITLGPFGVHRLYLGTGPKVPVVYTLTLGGGLGILPLTDIVAIIITRDFEKYVDNPKVVMWIN